MVFFFFFFFFFFFTLLNLLSTLCPFRGLRFRGSASTLSLPLPDVEEDEEGGDVAVPTESKQPAQPWGGFRNSWSLPCAVVWPRPAPHDAASVPPPAASRFRRCAPEVGSCDALQERLLGTDIKGRRHERRKFYFQ